MPRLVLECRQEIEPDVRVPGREREVGRVDLDVDVEDLARVSVEPERRERERVLSVGVRPAVVAEQDHVGIARVEVVLE